VIVEVVTDNRNRTVAELRLAFSRGGGNLAENGAVAWQFEAQGVITVSTAGSDPDDIQLVAIEAGALDVEVADDGSTIEVYTEPGNTESVREALVAAGFAVENADLAKVPQNTVELDEPTAIATLKLLERLDDLDDVSKVHSNADFPDSVLEAAAG
jgi:transcriptional/translational regulatory protein YebC/TACO1